MNDKSERFLMALIGLIDSGIVRDGKHFAESIGYKPQVISDIRAAKQGVSDKFLTKAYAKYPQLNKIYIETGIGDKLNLNVDREYLPLVSDVEPVYERNERIRIPVVPLDATASFITTIEKGYKLDDIEFDWMEVEKEPGYNYNDLTIIFRTSGDSMYPTYRQRSRLLCNTVEKEKWDYLRGPVVVSTSTGMLLLKRITGKQGDAYILKSDNTLYGDIYVQSETILAIWKVEYVVFAPAE